MKSEMKQFKSLVERMQNISGVDPAYIKKAGLTDFTHDSETSEEEISSFSELKRTVMAPHISFVRVEMSDPHFGSHDFYFNKLPKSQGIAVYDAMERQYVEVDSRRGREIVNKIGFPVMATIVFTSERPTREKEEVDGRTPTERLALDLPNNMQRVIDRLTPTSGPKSIVADGNIYTWDDQRKRYLTKNGDLMKYLVVTPYGLQYKLLKEF